MALVLSAVNAKDPVVNHALPSIAAVDPGQVLNRWSPGWNTHSNAVFVLRGFQDPGHNRRGVWDDLVVVKVGARLQVFNGNADPSGYRPHPAFKKSLPTLQPGTYRYKVGLHQGPGGAMPYPALVNAGPQTVVRDNGVKETGYYGIHMHKGSLAGETASAGCMTIPAQQYERFLSTIRSAELPDGEILVILVAAD